MMIDTTLTPQLKTVTLDWRWNNHAFRAMNTNVQTRLYSQTDSEVLVDVEQLFNSFEKTLSRFNPHSELSRFNANEQSSFKASPTLLDGIEVALWAAKMTGGLYDPTILNDLERAGYDRSFEKINTATPLPQSPRDSSPYGPMQQPFSRPFTFRDVHLNRPRREIYKPDGVRLDLGGMGKGWTVDRAADRLQGLGPFLVNAGGDIFAYQSPPGQKGWDIDLVHPFKPDQFLGRVRLHHRALATSTLAKRRWQHNGQVRHHLIDPRTGQPADTDAVSVTVVTQRTVIAEVIAKVVLILGVEQGLAYLQQLPGIEGLICTAEATIVTSPGLESLLERLEPAGYTV
jgi:thiamine biosynthesis lipoprotein